MITLNMPYDYSSPFKEKRKVIYQYLINNLPKADSKLVPIPYEAIKHFKPLPKNIYKVYGMDTTFKTVLDSVSNQVSYFATTFNGRRIRKLALVYFNNEPRYIIFQQTIQYSSILVVLDINNKKVLKLKNINQTKLLINILHAPIEDMPLHINEKSPVIRGIVQERLKGA